MKQSFKAAEGVQIRKKYRIAAVLLSTEGAQEWPLYFTIVRKMRPKKKTVQELTQEALLKEYAPAGILVDHRGNIRYVHGQTGFCLKPSQAYAGVSNILKIVQKKLRRDLNATLYQAVTNRSVANSPLISITYHDETLEIRIRVIPLLKTADLRQDDDFYLIIFEQLSQQHQAVQMGPSIEDPLAVASVKQELNQIHDEILSKRDEMSDVDTQLENSRQELDQSRKKLHSVKANISDSETELQTLIQKIQESREDLEVLGNELAAVKNEIEINQPVEKNISAERLPIQEELDAVKNDLFMVNQMLDEKKNIMENIITEELSPVYEPTRFDHEKITFEQEIEPTSDSSNLSETADVVNKNVDTENSSYRFMPDLFAMNNATPEFHNEEECLFSDTESKLISPEALSPNSHSEASPVAALTERTELVFEDPGAFQAAANHGYRHDSEIKSVLIPEGVEIIKRSMFYKCSKLETVTFPSTLKVIEDFVFYGCDALKNINLDHCTVLEVIGTSAFEGCCSLTQLVIPDAVIEIEEAAFLGCQSLNSITFLENSQLETLGSHAFKDCAKINQMILPDLIKHIGISCFYGCHNLTEIHLPDKLETVGEYAFFGCTTLKKIGFSNKKILKQPGFLVGFPEGVML